MTKKNTKTKETPSPAEEIQKRIDQAKGIAAQQELQVTRLRERLEETTASMHRANGYAEGLDAAKGLISTEHLSG